MFYNNIINSMILLIVMCLANNQVTTANQVTSITPNETFPVEVTKPSYFPTFVQSQLTVEPSKNPTMVPTKEPTLQPSKSVTINPSKVPTVSPTSQPSKNPTMSPTTNTSKKTTSPSSQPSKNPSTNPTTAPSKQSSTSPTSQPSKNPTMSQPSKNQTMSPTTNPSKKTTTSPSSQPSKNPSTNPTITPNKQLSTSTTSQPSKNPTVNPTTTSPSSLPSKNPSINPTTAPSKQSSTSPTSQPSKTPTMSPTTNPSKKTTSPTKPTSPTNQPSKNPSTSPSSQPSKNPSTSPTTAPTKPLSAPPTSQSNGYKFVAGGVECSTTAVEYAVFKTTDQCATFCINHKSMYFIFGTIEYNYQPPRCQDGLCLCYCEVDANNNNEVCEQIVHTGYNLFKLDEITTPSPSQSPSLAPSNQPTQYHGYEFISGGMECSTTAVKSAGFENINECADFCFNESYYFIFGTNKYGYLPARCQNGFCLCYCEVAVDNNNNENDDVICDQIVHTGYNLFKFDESTQSPSLEPTTRLTQSPVVINVETTMESTQIIPFEADEYSDENESLYESQTNIVIVVAIFMVFICGIACYTRKFFMADDKEGYPNSQKIAKSAEGFLESQHDIEFLQDFEIVVGDPKNIENKNVVEMKSILEIGDRISADQTSNESSHTDQTRHDEEISLEKKKNGGEDSYNGEKIIIQEDYDHGNSEKKIRKNTLKTSKNNYNNKDSCNSNGMYDSDSEGQETTTTTTTFAIKSSHNNYCRNNNSAVASGDGDDITGTSDNWHVDTERVGTYV